MRAKRNEPLIVVLAVCLAGAVLALGIGMALGAWRGGVAAALGLLIGSANGFLARRALGLDASFLLTSVGRMAVLSVLGVGLGVLLGIVYVPLVLLGLGASQLVLAAVSGMAAARA